MNTTNATHEQNRRIQERWALVNYDLLVYPEGADAPIGQVKDFNTQGMRLLTERPIADDELGGLRIEKSGAGGSPESVVLATDKIWSQKKAGNGHTETGLQFIDPQDAMAFIGNLLPHGPQLDVEFKYYQKNLEGLDRLEGLESAISRERILRTLNSRDALQTALSQNHACPTQMLLDIFDLDRNLQAKAKQIARRSELGDWRKSLDPSDKKWWWFLDQGRNWILGLLSACLIFLTLGVLIYILPRLFTGGVSGEVALFTMLQTAIVYTGAKGALTRALPQKVESFFIEIGVPEYRLDSIIFSFALLAFVLAAGTYFLFPAISAHYHEKGIISYNAGDYRTAEINYQKALKLTPDNVQTRLDLGLNYEDKRNFKDAMEQYQLAADLCIGQHTDLCGNVQNNLARLFILNEKYDTAIATLNLLKLSPADAKLKYFIYKNLGWAEFKQGQMEQAQTYLQTAIDSAHNTQPAMDQTAQASANCLLAQVSEKLNADSTQILPYWTNCFDYNEQKLPEEKIWYGMAMSRLYPEVSDHAVEDAQK